MSSWLRKTVTSFRKPISPVSLGRDVLATSIKVTQKVDKLTGATDKLGKAAFRKFGPASPRVIKAADAVANSGAARGIVKAAKSGGPLTKVFNTAYGATRALDRKLGISDKLSKLPPLPPHKTKTHVKAAPLAQGSSRGGVAGTAGKPASAVPARSASNFKLPHYKLKLPRLGQSLAKVRAQQGRAGVLSTPASRAAWSAKHMKIRTAPSTNARMVLRPQSSKAAKPAPSNRFNAAPTRRSAPVMKPAGPARGFRR